MYNFNLLAKTLLAVLALIVGASFGYYIWNSGTNPVIAGNSDPVITNSSTPVVFSENGSNKSNSTGIPDDNVGGAGVRENSEPSIEPEIGLSVEKYVADSIEGPWYEANKPEIFEFHSRIYWKVIVENTGNLELQLTYRDMFDGVEVEMMPVDEGVLPDTLDSGEMAELVYTVSNAQYVHEGDHWNMINVTASYGDEIFYESDRACYRGIRLQTSIMTRQDPPIDMPIEEPPKFVIPEYPLGVLGSILALAAATIFSKKK